MKNLPEHQKLVNIANELLAMDTSSYEFILVKGFLEDWDSLKDNLHKEEDGSLEDIYTPEETLND